MVEFCHKGNIKKKKDLEEGILVVYFEFVGAKEVEAVGGFFL